ncbi:MAG: hypothetical protein AB7S45_00685, partial [Pseudothermotoga sp.]
EVLWSIKFGRTYLSSVGEIHIDVSGNSVGETVKHDGSVVLRIENLPKSNLLTVTRRTVQSFSVEGVFEKKIETEEKEDLLILLAFDEKERPILISNPIYLIRGERR